MRYYERFFHIIRQIYNKKQHKEALHKPDPYAKLHYHIEKAAIGGGFLYVRGWIYFERYFSDHVTVVLEGKKDGVEFKQNFDAVLRRREDVKCVMGPELYGDCGVELYTPVENCDAPEIKLKMTFKADILEVVPDCSVELSPIMQLNVTEQEKSAIELEYTDQLIPIELMKTCAGRGKTTATLNIGIFGNEWSKKRQKNLRRYLKQMYEQIGEDKVCIYRIGKVLLNDLNIIQLGSFPASMLPGVVLEHDMDILILPEDNIPAVNFTSVRKMLNDRVYTKRIVFFIDYYSYAARYRVEHFREKLQWQGIGSDFYMLHEADNLNLSLYSDIVVYRCSDVERVSILVRRAEESGIDIYYDIDDFIFDYSAIDNLDFLQDSEYSDFRQKSEATRDCMKKIHNIIVSTDQLKVAVGKTFPDKNVYVNRNCASLEMYILSERAIQNVVKHEDRFVIGYFSGSGTHNRDFELIAPVILEIMKDNKKVHLLIVGCMKLPECFDEYCGRIEKKPFMDWRDLPGCIASVDLNIQPLQDTFFHSCKSENKWMEAALVSVPTIASYNEELAQIIQQGEDGFLCRDQDEWKTQIEAMIDDPGLANKIGQHAHDRVLREYLSVQHPFDGFQHT